MKVSFEGVGENTATFINAKDNVAKVGSVVKISANSEVSSCADGDKFMGVVTLGDMEYACVQFCGFAKVDYSGSDISAGYAQLSADGNGGVKADSNGKEYLVVSVNSTEKTAFILL